MIRTHILILIIACNEVLYIYSLNKDTSKATFGVFSEGQYFTASLFDKRFHQCSREDNCNFVAKNLKTSIFSKYVNEGHLPEERKNFIIFKKNFAIFKKKKCEYFCTGKEVSIFIKSLRRKNTFCSTIELSTLQDNRLFHKTIGIE